MRMQSTTPPILIRRAAASSRQAFVQLLICSEATLNPFNLQRSLAPNASTCSSHSASQQTIQDTHSKKLGYGTAESCSRLKDRKRLQRQEV
ncbi:hypothetical protein EJ03DRAFT_27971 [Teratosphaeria nubilosa]|uniref:Uncharacterized protein n=1 Tax=Teratosphaeria nubilosa TaxID=161662 RepID=A0A6G1KUT3_9PEZI|nr:hypothetical protein EJ03DRAFT_27971 [Teratosphaeria nubilosa]